MRRISLVLCGLLLATSYAWPLSAEEAAPDPLKESPISDLDREHWAFQSLKKPALPVVRDEHGWAQTPLDAFVLQKLERRELSPRPEATRAQLLRRLSFDLLGLPPTPEQLAAFENDQSPNAYERLVDRLLASPHYGETWGQHWLDLARFAETDGFEHDRTRASAWKYRDWVIRALNRDLSYDRFLALQLAGDELAPGDADAEIATMFCLSGPDMPDINRQDLRRHDLLNEMTGTVGSTFMALQFGCCQCHDHKYDPLSQADFYRLRAFFEPAVATKKDVLVSVMRETKREPAPTFVYLRGDVDRPGPVIEPAFPRVLNEAASALTSPDASAKSSHRRAALAAWLTRDDHPLTARVIANRVWQHHFGRGLATTPSDFGTVGDEPTHPALLDWLAVELTEHDWSLKHLHRLIVTSAVYRAAPAQQGDDPALYVGYPRRRLPAEALRDALLVVSDQLSIEAGGPGVMPPLAPEIASTLLKDQWKVNADPADHVRRSVYIFARRNLRYPLLDAFDRADANQTCAARHVSTTAPQALTMLNSEFSLDVARRLAGGALAESRGDVEQAFEIACIRCFARPPTTSERRMLLSFLEQQTKRLAAEKREGKSLALPIPQTDGEPTQAAAFVDFCLALINTSEFVYVD